METVNALRLRNHLGEILERLGRTGEPIRISKGRKVRAVLVTPEQFETRFLDWQAEEDRRRFLQRVQELRGRKRGGESTLTVLRKVRGYGT